MNNIDIFMAVLLLAVIDPVREGIPRLIEAFFRNLPSLIAALFNLVIYSPRHLKNLFLSVKEYFTSPIFQKRAKKFKTLKRGYYSFILIIGCYALSLLLPLLVTNQALYVSYEGRSYFPAARDFVGYYSSWFVDEIVEVKWYYTAEDFGEKGNLSPANYRDLKAKWEAEGSSNSVTLAPYPYSPNESNLTEYVARPPHAPDERHILGTDDRARDVFARMVYGFQISITFAIVVTFFSYLIGVSIGGFLGYYGGIFDIVVQRVVEVWSAIPFLFTVMIVVSIMQTASVGLLIGLLASFGWMGMTYYIRGEFLREKAKDYVSAAISIGVKDTTIIFRHILPNALTPVISFMPFAIVGNINSLVSLDFLGFGLPAPTPSWGELMSQATANLNSWWLVGAPLGGLFFTLMLVSFIGEAVREAFDPKQYSRLR